MTNKKFTIVKRHVILTEEYMNWLSKENDENQIESSFKGVKYW